MDLPCLTILLETQPFCQHQTLLINKTPNHPLSHTTIPARRMEILFSDMWGLAGLRGVVEFFFLYIYRL
jgi:hypothetical protein